MAFDLFQSRRNFNEHCRFWTRNESEKYDECELVYKRVASGSFWAKEVNAEVTNDNIINGVIILDRTSVTIMSPDNLEDITSRDVVEYQGELWRVENCQKRKAKIQNREFGKVSSVSHYWYLTLIK